jgi:hypothetical protein
MPSDELLSLCTHVQTIASALERDPSASPAALASQLCPRLKSGRAPSLLKEKAQRHWEDYTIDDLDRAERCGRFGRRPGELFLRVCTCIGAVVIVLARHKVLI